MIILILEGAVSAFYPCSHFADDDFFKVTLVGNGRTRSFIILQINLGLNKNHNIDMILSLLSLILCLDSVIIRSFQEHIFFYSSVRLYFK